MATENSKKDNLIWLDLEMTGLVPRKDKIIESAIIITDSDLNIIAEGPEIAIHQADDVLASMDKWNVEQHTKSGLLDRVRKSKISVEQAEEKNIEFMRQHVAKGKSPMCGNTICQDRRFLFEYMPDMANFFHYRNLDVSTIKILVQRWAPQLVSGVEKESQHLAKHDIIDSINELKYYRQCFFK